MYNYGFFIFLMIFMSFRNVEKILIFFSFIVDIKLGGKLRFFFMGNGICFWVVMFSLIFVFGEKELRY